MKVYLGIDGFLLTDRSPTVQGLCEFRAETYSSRRGNRWFRVRFSKPRLQPVINIFLLPQARVIILPYHPIISIILCSTYIYPVPWLSPRYFDLTLLAIYTAHGLNYLRMLH